MYTYNKKRSEKFIDIHCHCLPGLDDGPATINDAIMLCKTLVDDGMAIVVATPHQLGRFEGRNEASVVREAVDNFNEILEKCGIYLKIVPGGEVRVDERLCRLLETDIISTLGDGGKYVLLELPHQVFIDIEPLIKELSSLGISVVISHAERYASLIKKHDVLLRWLDHSVNLQITASSLVGVMGSEAERTAWDYLKNGLVSIVATDSHDSNIRRPRMKAAFRIINDVLGEEIARLVCTENPSRILSGKEIMPVLPYTQQEIFG